jgi:hypothetical protein
MTHFSGRGYITHTPAYTHPEQSGKQQKNNDRKHRNVISFNEKENVNDLKLFHNKDPHYENL